jgi:ABC-2 type transport system ATP-binding protein
VTGNEPLIDAEARSANAPTTGGVDALVAVATQLRDAGIAVEDLSISQPTLDDVFLTLTGEPCQDCDEEKEKTS